MDSDLMPKEHGGTKNFDEVVEDISELYEKHGKCTKSYYDIKIDWSKVSEVRIWNDDETENNGSFRKHEVDWSIFCYFKIKYSIEF